MKVSNHQKTRSNQGNSTHICTPVEQTISSPELKLPKLWGNLKKKERLGSGNAERTPRDGGSASESNLSSSKSTFISEDKSPSKRQDVKTKLTETTSKEPSRRNEVLIQADEKFGQGDDRISDETPEVQGTSSSGKESVTQENLQALWKADRLDKRYARTSKISRSCSPPTMDQDDPLTRQIRDIHNNTRKSARIIRDSRARLLEIQKKQILTEADVKELGERNELLLREMDRFDRLTRSVQKLVGAEVLQQRKLKEPSQQTNHMPISVYEPAINHEMKMTHPTVLLAGGRPLGDIDPPTRSKSEIDLSRKLCESYDMQEKLVADNADLEVKRYVLYKELMTKDQNLEICRAQIKRLQGELKLIHKENTSLQEKLSKNNPQGDATSLIQDNCTQYELDANTQEGENLHVNPQELISKLQHYQTYTEEIEKGIGELELEVRNLREEMDRVKAGSACRGGGGVNTCFEQPSGGPPVPPMTRASRYKESINCGVCPPCPAPCNPNGPPTPAEREVQRLTTQLRQTEESFKTKVTECAILRADVLKKKEELEKERCQHREVQNKLRELEMKFEGLATTTNMALGSKEQAFEQEVNVRTLKQCYREAREEIDELRLLMKEQNEQLQDYRVKYLQAQQLVEEQRRQMDMMDMDNTRISEQINLEIQKVKFKFQEKLQELAPLPDLLKATQMKLKEAQQSQATAEHNAEQLARELNSAREKVHVLLHNSQKPPEKAPERGGDEKQVALLQQRIAQLLESNSAYKTEIERLKGKLIRLEESLAIKEKGLLEKMHECATLGGMLDMEREITNEAIERTVQRSEAMRQCMQQTIAELEQQLASSRTLVTILEKEKKEVRNRMDCQINRLLENFEQAQLRIQGLQTQVQKLRGNSSSTEKGDGEEQNCSCSNLFNSP